MDSADLAENPASPCCTTLARVARVDKLHSRAPSSAFSPISASTGKAGFQELAMFFAGYFSCASTSSTHAKAFIVVGKPSVVVPNRTR